MLIKFTDDKRCSGIAKKPKKITKATKIREGSVSEGSHLLDQMTKKI